MNNTSPDHEDSVFGEPLDRGLTEGWASGPPLHPEIVEAWKRPAVEDVVPRGAPDPEAVAALEAQHGKPVTMAFHEMTEHGVRTEYVDALLLVGGMPSPFGDPACDD